MWAISVPDGVEVVAVRDALLQEGVIIRPIPPNHMSMCPPLVITDEQIDKIDDAERTYTYRIIESPLPLQDYLSTLRVVDAEGGCCVEWSANFKVSDGPAEDTIAAIQGIYDAGMEALRESFKG